MSAGGVIPAPEDRGAARETGRMTDVDDVPVVFSINRDGTARIAIATTYTFRQNDPACADFDQAKAGEFTRLWSETLRRASTEGSQETGSDG